MLTTTVQITCDDCATVSHTAAGISGTQLRRDLEAEGWTHTDRKDRCGGCTAARVKRLAEERAALRAGQKKTVAPV